MDKETSWRFEDNCGHESDKIEDEYKESELVNRLLKGSMQSSKKEFLTWQFVDLTL